MRENQQHYSQALPRFGSPPRMRGKLYPITGMPVVNRITPAHAGKTCPPLCRCCGLSDHPRACGENTGARIMDGDIVGSPPRMRGKLFLWIDNGKEARITPAHAGKTPLRGRGLRRRSDHPRACGENLYGVRASLSQCGSPPRMRGKRPRPVSAAESPRITPAHAGKTCAFMSMKSLYADHPRACGENAKGGQQLTPDSGSPPRMRGKPSLEECRIIEQRITPAHAGKTAGRCGRESSRTDHPRACGENDILLMTAFWLCGSPPRMRGKRLPLRFSSCAARITPAHAGKTKAFVLHPNGVSDHPRACGEN